MAFNIAQIINKFLPVQVIGNQLSNSVTLHNSTANGVGSALSLSGEGYVILSVTGTFSATLNFQGQAPNGSWFPINAINKRHGTISTQTTESNQLFEIDARGLSAIRVNVTNYSSGTVQISGKAQAIAPPSTQFREPVYTGKQVSTGQRKVVNIASPVTISDISLTFKSITIKADETNTGKIFIGGGTDITSNNSFSLTPGSATTLSGDFKTTALYITAEQVNDGISWMGVY